VSKRQEKIQANIDRQQRFIKERRKIQLAWFEQNFEFGKQLFKDNKDKMNETEIVAMEKEMQLNVEYIANFKKEWGLEDEAQEPELD
jgi:hypothetical protein